MSTSYTIQNKEGLHFLTTTVVAWVDVFTRKAYRDLILESIAYCRKEKQLNLHAYVIMSNHIHWIASAHEGSDLSAIVRDFKKFTSKKIVEHITNNNEESRREWILNMFRFVGKQNKHNKEFQFWQNDNHAEIIFSEKFLKEKLDCIHYNPVKAGWVEKPEDYLYSSAKDYIGQKGLIEIDTIILHDFVK